MSAWIPRPARPHPSLAAALLLCSVAACGGAAPRDVPKVGALRLTCPQSEIDTSFVRRTPKVSEWVAHCDFMYVKVHCRDGNCQPADPEPPCLGDTPCFEEDPVTLKWVMREEVGRERAR